jgi:hypothetical protein
MLKSSDGLLTVDSSKGEYVFPASDCSILLLPKTIEETRNLFKSIYNTPVENHVCLLVARHNKYDIINSIGNLSLLEEDKLSYLDNIAITYQHSSKRGGVFSHLAEYGFIYYKGTTPEINNTSWFNTEFKNATNHWDLTPHQHSSDVKEDGEMSVYPKSAWDVNLLMLSLATPLRTRRIVYNLAWDENLLKFVKKFGIGLTLYVSNAAEEKDVINTYEKIL